MAVDNSPPSPSPSSNIIATTTTATTATTTINTNHLISTTPPSAPPRFQSMSQNTANAKGPDASSVFLLTMNGILHDQLLFPLLLIAALSAIILLLAGLCCLIQTRRRKYPNRHSASFNNPQSSEDLIGDALYKTDPSMDQAPSPLFSALPARPEPAWKYTSVSERGVILQGSKNPSPSNDS